MCLAQGPQRSEAGEARTHGLSVSSQALYHWATALPWSGGIAALFFQADKYTGFHGKPCVDPESCARGGSILQSRGFLFYLFLFFSKIMRERGAKYH